MLDRTQPGLPMKKGRAGTMTHDYKRNGTTTLFAAMNVLDGTVIGRNMQRHRHQEFFRFLNAVERESPQARPSTRSSTTTPPQASGGPKMAGAPSALDIPLHADLGLLLNAVEGFFATLSPSAVLKPCIFQSVVDLQAAINRFFDDHNAKSKPFQWVSDPEKIIQAVRRGHQALDSIH